MGIQRQTIQETSLEPEAVPEPGPKASQQSQRAARLTCSCGVETFYVTRVDFTCTACAKSYRD